MCTPTARRCSSSPSTSTCFRGLYYGSYKAPRELLWILGVIIYLLMMATGFMGYVLPWGQMSFWGATVITNLFSAIPLVGDAIATWLLGRLSVGNPTLNRFFSLHYLLPFVIAGVVILHIWALHVTGPEQPAGIEVKGPRRTPCRSTPYYTVKDGFGMVVFLMLLRLLRVLRAELSRPPGQLHPGQPAGDAGAYRAGMVLPAVLRDPAPVLQRNRLADLVLSTEGAVHLPSASRPVPTAENEFHLHPKQVSAHSDGPFGHYDKAQLQRGFRSTSEVCSACHSLNLVAFRDLEELGYNEDEVKAIAKGWKINDA
jgi:hypothetical protein